MFIPQDVIQKPHALQICPCTAAKNVVNKPLMYNLKHNYTRKKHVNIKNINEEFKNQRSLGDFSFSFIEIILVVHIKMLRGTVNVGVNYIRWFIK